MAPLYDPVFRPLILFGFFTRIQLLEPRTVRSFQTCNVLGFEVALGYTTERWEEQTVDVNKTATLDLRTQKNLKSGGSLADLDDRRPDSVMVRYTVTISELI
jgi:hypothetical protein